MPPRSQTKSTAGQLMITLLIAVAR